MNFVATVLFLVMLRRTLKEISQVATELFVSESYFRSHDEV